MIDYSPIIVPEDIYPAGVKEKIQELAKVLLTIEQEVDFITEIGCRGGYIQDILRNQAPSDFDLFYAVTPHLPRCQCDEIRKYLVNKDFALFRGIKVDLGHLEPEEMSSPLNYKTVGPFSHHDMSSRFYLNSQGEIWTNKTTLSYHLSNIYEISFLGWLQFMKFPLTKNPAFHNYYLFIVTQTLRSIRMIHTKKYSHIGDEFRASLGLFPEAMSYCLKSNQYTTILSDILTHHMKGMSFAQIIDTLSQFNIKNYSDIKQALQTLKDSEQ